MLPILDYFRLSFLRILVGDVQSDNCKLLACIPIGLKARSLARALFLSLSTEHTTARLFVRRLLESKSNRQSKRNCRVERTCWSFAVACFGGARSSSSVCAFAFAVANSHRLVARQPWQLQATQVLHVN